MLCRQGYYALTLLAFFKTTGKYMTYFRIIFFKLDMYFSVIVSIIIWYASYFAPWHHSIPSFCNSAIACIIIIKIMLFDLIQNTCTRYFKIYLSLDTLVGLSMNHHRSLQEMVVVGGSVGRIPLK